MRFINISSFLFNALQAILTDRIVNMCKFLSLKTEEWNFAMVLWRSSQLYSASFAYTLLSLMTGKN